MSKNARNGHIRFGFDFLLNHERLANVCSAILCTRSLYRTDDIVMVFLVGCHLLFFEVMKNHLVSQMWTASREHFPNVWLTILDIDSSFRTGDISMVSFVGY